MRNSKSRISENQFESLLQSSINDLERGILNMTATASDEKYGITMSDPIPIECIFVIRLYCNDSTFCAEFRESYRSDDADDTNRVQEHVDNFYWFGRFLYVAITYFGRRPRKKEQFYHGLNIRFLFDSFSAVLEAPTSTTVLLNKATEFAGDSGGVVLKLSPKFRDELNLSRCLDVSDISTFGKQEDERLFAGMTTLAIVDIYSVFDGQWEWMTPHIQSLLYFERIIEQTVHQTAYYNHGGTLNRQKQRKYLVPLIKHQMARTRSGRIFRGNINESGVSEQELYARRLFEHFCDSKVESIDLTLIEEERNGMDESLINILWTKVTSKRIPRSISSENIMLIFPNLKQYKNSMDYWVRLKRDDEMSPMENDSKDDEKESHPISAAAKFLSPQIGRDHPGDYFGDQFPDRIDSRGRRSVIEFKWNKDFKQMHQCDTLHMLYLLQLACDLHREWVIQRNKHFMSIARADRYVSHVDTPQIITNFIEWHNDDLENNVFTGEMLTMRNNWAMIIKMISEIGTYHMSLTLCHSTFIFSILLTVFITISGKTSKGAATQIIAKLSSEVLIEYDQWTETGNIKLRLETWGLTKMYRGQTVLEECTVEQIVTLFEYRAPTSEEKEDDEEPVRNMSLCF